MKTFLLVLLTLLVFFNTTYAKSDDAMIEAKTLYKFCVEYDDISKANDICFGYITGVQNSLQLLDYFNKDKIICILKSESQGAAVNTVKDYLKNTQIN